LSLNLSHQRRHALQSCVQLNGRALLLLLLQSLERRGQRVPGRAQLILNSRHLLPQTLRVLHVLPVQGFQVTCSLVLKAQQRALGRTQLEISFTQVFLQRLHPHPRRVDCCAVNRKPSSEPP
jgi:hypothetical protein